MNMMVKLGDIDNFDKIKEVADKVEKERIMSRMKLSEREKDIISEHILEYVSKHGNTLTSLGEITGLSGQALAHLRDKKHDSVRTKTYEIFKKVIDAQLTKDAQLQEVESIKAEKERVAQEEAESKLSEFEIMAQMDSLFASLDESARHRVLAYFESKYILPQLDEVLNESD